MSSKYHVDEKLGVAVLDRYTWAIMDGIKKMNNIGISKYTIQALYDDMDIKFLSSNHFISHSKSGLPKDQPNPRQRLLIDFFGSCNQARVIKEQQTHQSEYEFKNFISLKFDPVYPQINLNPIDLDMSYTRMNYHGSFHTRPSSPALDFSLLQLSLTIIFLFMGVLPIFFRFRGNKKSK